VHEVTAGHATRTAPPGGEPQSRPDRPGGRRLITSAVALLVAAAAAGLAVRAFVGPEERRPRSAVGSGTIAFVSGARGEVWTVRAEGSHLSSIPLEVPGGVVQVAWSPDGRQIAYALQDGGGSNIFVMQADGGGPSRVTTGQGFDVSPTWSPDGSRLAFARASGGTPTSTR
jgi:TolB protein